MPILIVDISLPLFFLGVTVPPCFSLIGLNHAYSRILDHGHSKWQYCHPRQKWKQNQPSGCVVEQRHYKREVREVRRRDLEGRGHKVGEKKGGESWEKLLSGERERREWRKEKKATERENVGAVRTWGRRSSEWCKRVGWNLLKSKSQGKCAAVKEFCSL